MKDREYGMGRVKEEGLKIIWQTIPYSNYWHTGLGHNHPMQAILYSNFRDTGLGHRKSYGRPFPTVTTGHRPRTQIICQRRRDKG